MGILKKNTSCRTAAATNEAPVLSETVDLVPVYTVPNESGYFPTGFTDEILVSCPNVQLYQMQNLQEQSAKSTKTPTLLSQGTLSLRDPAPGTPDEVVLVGECDGVMFYVMNEDVTFSISQTELALICVPSMECLYLSLASAGSDCAVEEHVLLHIQGLFAARTNLYQSSSMLQDQVDLARGEGASSRDVIKTGQSDKPDKEDIRSMIPDDKLHQSIYQSSVWISKQIVRLSEVGAKQLGIHGEQHRSSIRSSFNNNKSEKDTGEEDNATSENSVKVHPKAIQTASHIRRLSKDVYRITEKVSDTISNFVGDKLGNAVTGKTTDGQSARSARQILRTSVLAYGEVTDGVSEGYDILARATKREATAYVAVKYGEEAADLARHTLGATINFGKTALTMRRVLNVKKVVSSSAKTAVKQSLLK